MATTVKQTADPHLLQVLSLPDDLAGAVIGSKEPVHVRGRLLVCLHPLHPPRGVLLHPLQLIEPDVDYTPFGSVEFVEVTQLEKVSRGDRGGRFCVALQIGRQYLDVFLAIRRTQSEVGRANRDDLMGAALPANHVAWMELHVVPPNETRVDIDNGRDRSTAPTPRHTKA